MFIKFSFVSQKLQFLCLRVSSIALTQDNDNQVVFSFLAPTGAQGVKMCVWTSVHYIIQKNMQNGSKSISAAF